MTPDGGGRDLRELILIDEVFRQRKPLLAICRGHQLLNIALGGKLIADIRRQVPGALNHQRLDKAGEIVHEVPLTAGSLLAKITGRRVLGVNSSHHQAVLEPAEPLVAVARTRRRNCGSDGIEAGRGEADAVFVGRAISSRTADGATRRTSRDFSPLHPGVRSEN